MPTPKPAPGADFPAIEVSMLGGGQLRLGHPSAGHDWQIIVVYRGKHCPICTRYLREVNEISGPLAEIGVEVVAVSADSEARAQTQIAEVNPNYPVGYGLSVEQMQQLGLYVSSPRHGIDVEGPFAEPAVFVVNEDQELRMVEITNVPFIRPQVSTLLGGIKFMRGMTETFPANGTFA